MDLFLYLFSKNTLFFFSRNELARPLKGTIFLVHDVYSVALSESV